MTAMTAPLRVCIWSSGFQADTQALALALAAEPDIALTVALPEPARYLAEPVNRFLPLDARLVDRATPGLARTLAREGFDLLIVDNHLPDTAIAPRLLVLWHGFGWRIDDLSTMRRELGKLVGDVTRPNPRFRWQAVGAWDRDYRIRHSGLAPENVVALGSAYSDLLRPGHQPLDRAALAALAADRYTVDLTRPLVLLGLTWHHGAALAQWGDDAALLARLFAEVEARGAGVLLRMHDRHRFEPAYLRQLEAAIAGRPGVQLRFKDEHPDSLVDLLLADVLVSNYSSLLNAWYHTGKPSVHLDPHAPGQAVYQYRRWKGGRLRAETRKRAEEVWKLDPGEIGGLRARSFEEALAQVARGLAEPGCCAAAARGFTDRYVLGADGGTRARMLQFLREWLAAR